MVVKRSSGIRWGFTPNRIIYGNVSFAHGAFYWMASLLEVNLSHHVLPLSLLDTHASHTYQIHSILSNENVTMKRSGGCDPFLWLHSDTEIANIATYLNSIDG